MNLLESFEQFKTNIEPTEDQIESISKSHNYIRSVLKSEKIVHVIDSFLVGSYSRKTLIRPIKDVDIFIKLHYEKHKDQTPKDILNLLKRKVSKTFPNSFIRKDSPCVVINFKHCTFELIPAFGYENDESMFSIPSYNSLYWIDTSPRLFNELISTQNSKHEGKLIPLIKMMKNWKIKNCMGLKSYHLEGLTLLIFNDKEINNYPLAIHQWFNNASSILRYDEPVICEFDDNSKYIDQYLYSNRAKLKAVRNKIEQGKLVTDKGYCNYLIGKDMPARLQYYKLFTNFPLFRR